MKQEKELDHVKQEKGESAFFEEGPGLPARLPLRIPVFKLAPKASSE